MVAEREHDFTVSGRAEPSTPSAESAQQAELAAAQRRRPGPQLPGRRVRLRAGGRAGHAPWDPRLPARPGALPAASHRAGAAAGGERAARRAADQQARRRVLPPSRAAAGQRTGRYRPVAGHQPAGPRWTPSGWSSRTA